MAKSKEEQIFELALKYRLDGASLIEALNKANKEYEASLSRRTKLTEAQATKIKQMLIAKEKETLKQLELEQAKSQRKQDAERRRDIQRRWDERRRINTRRLKEEEAQERASARKKVEDQKNTFAGGWANFGKKLGTISSYGGAIAIITAITTAFKTAVSTAIELETAFVDLRVKSGYSNREMAEVSKTILDVAQSTKFSTLEITGAATALGKLGFEANEVIKMLPNLANLAGATGESLQASAEILGKVINAYEFTAEQSGIIADRMVDVFNNSALSLEKFNTAFSYVGSAAASTGTSFNELTSAMAVLSDRGITASKIGTGLRNVFTKLGEEGDSLRDILQRISDAHLSFYEVAELVGRRAANQLFIMADSLDEFDANVARSMNDYGEALKASAIQMDTFSAKYDILINTLKNKVAPEFDPNKTWRQSMEDSIGLMDLMNILLDEDNTIPFLERQIALYPEFEKEFELARNSVKEGASDYEILSALIRETNESLSDAKGKFGIDSEEVDSLEGYISALNKIRDTLDRFGETRLSDVILGKAEDFDENKNQKRLISYTDLVKNIVAKTDKELGSAKRDSFVEAFILGNKPEVAKSILEELKELDKLTQKEFIKILEGRGNSENFSELQKAVETGAFAQLSKKLQGQYKVIGGENLLELLEKQYLEQVAGIRRINKGFDELNNQTDANDEKNITERIENRTRIAKKICEIDPVYASKLGIVCEEARKERKRAEIGKIDSFSELREEYKTEKAKLKQQFKDIPDDDPIAKLEKNRELLDLEQKFREDLNQKYEEYLNKQQDIRASFIAKYPEQASQFDANVKSTEDARTKDLGASDRAINEALYQNIDAKADAFKKDLVQQAEYNLEKARLDNELKLTDRKDTKERKRIIEEKNKLTDDFYRKQMLNLAHYGTDLQRQLEEIRNKNAITTVGLTLGTSDGVLIDTTQIEKLISELETLMKNLETERLKSQETGNKFDTQDFDYFPLIMDATEKMYEVYRIIGDRKLELLKEQTERELEIVQQRFDLEGEIRTSALQSNIISQEQATEAEERARKQKIDKENKINRKLFEAQKKRDKEDAIFTGLTSIASAIANIFAKNAGNPVAVAILTSISAAAVAASTAANISAISSRKFVPQKYADGGLIEGKSHAQGGVPFTVGGRGGFEAEGGEFIVNKEATKKHLSELQRINAKTQKSKSKFATGGYVESVNDSDDFNQLLLDALNRPVRAYVTDQDLSKSTSEREALTKKISY